MFVEFSVDSTRRPTRNVIKNVRSVYRKQGSLRTYQDCKASQHTISWSRCFPDHRGFNMYERLFSSNPEAKIQTNAVHRRSSRPCSTALRCASVVAVLLFAYLAYANIHSWRTDKLLEATGNSTLGVRRHAAGFQQVRTNTNISSGRFSLSVYRPGLIKEMAWLSQQHSQISRSTLLMV